MAGDEAERPEQNAMAGLRRSVCGVLWVPSLVLIGLSVARVALLYAERIYSPLTHLYASSRPARAKTFLRRRVLLCGFLFSLLGFAASGVHAQGPTPPVCDRTSQVQTGILDKIPGVSNCANVTDAHLSGITGVLDLSNDNIATLRTGDFSGLGNLRVLLLGSNDLTFLQANVFSGLDGLEALGLGFNSALTVLDSNAFSGLVNLKELDLFRLGGGSREVALVPGLFSDLRAIEYLYIDFVNLAPLPEGIFEGLTNLKDLKLSGDALLSFRFERADGSANQDSEQLKLISVQGAPYDLTVTLSASGGDLSTTQVMISAGAVASTPFNVTRSNDLVEVVHVEIIHVGRSITEPPSFPPPDCNDPGILLSDIRLGCGVAAGRITEDSFDTSAEFRFLWSPLNLSFTTPADNFIFGTQFEIIDVYQVKSGLTRELELELENAELLTEGESVTVNFEVRLGSSLSGDLSVSPPLAVMSATTPRVSLELSAAWRLSAVRQHKTFQLRAFASAVPDNVTVSEETAEVVIVAREYRLNLNPTDFVVGRTSTATLSLEGDDPLLEGQSVDVSLSVAEAGASVLPSEVVFNPTSMSVEVEVSVPLSVVSEGSNLSFVVEDPSAGSAQGSPYWLVNNDGVDIRNADDGGEGNFRLSFSRAFRLAFVDSLNREIDVLSVAGGESADFGLSLLGAELGEGESLEVRLGVSSSEGEGASLVGGDTLRFVQGTSSATTSVSVTRDSPLSAFSVLVSDVTLTLLADNARVTTESLAVEVIRNVELSLSSHAGQAVEMVTIVEGESTEITVSTDPLLVGNERVTVTLSVAEGLSVEGVDSELIGGNVLVLASGENSSTRVRVRALTPGLDSEMGVSASGEGDNVTVVGEAPSLRVRTKLLIDVTTVVLPSGPVKVQQGKSRKFSITTDPPLKEGQVVTVQLGIEPSNAGLSFADGLPSTRVTLVENQLPFEVQVEALPDAELENSARVTPMVVDHSPELQVNIDSRSETTLRVVIPRGNLGLRPHGGRVGDALRVGLGERLDVELVLTGLTLRGNQRVVFQLVIEGQGVELVDGVMFVNVIGPLPDEELTSTQVHLSADTPTATITIEASDKAYSRGKLAVEALSGVAFHDDPGATDEPTNFLHERNLIVEQSVSLNFNPPEVLIQRGRSTQFEVTTIPRLVADRKVAVTLGIPQSDFEDGFSFGDGSAQHRVVLDKNRASRMVTVKTTTTATIDSPVAVAVTQEDVSPIPRAVLLGQRPDLVLRATTPVVAVVFDPADVLALPRGEEAEVGLSFDGSVLAEDQEVVLSVSVRGDGLAVNPPEVTLSRAMQSATVTVTAGSESMSGALTVTKVRGDVELMNDPAELPVEVLPRRNYSLSFDRPPLEVVANSTLTSSLSLTGADDLLPGEEVSVSLGVSGSGLSLRSAPQVLFRLGSTSVEVMLSASADAAETGSVSAAVQGDLPAGIDIDVDPVEAAVSVLPRELHLSFPSSPLLVRSGLNTSVELTLLGADDLLPDEEVVVSLGGLSGSDFQLNLRHLWMGRSTPSVSLSLTVPRELESAELTASASSLLVNAEVSSTSVGIRVLPREYALSFSPSSLPVAAGTAGSATLSLEGAYRLFAGESVAVSLSVAGVAVEGVSLLPDEVTFDSVSTSVEVEVGVLSSVEVATTRLLASVSSKPAWVSVSDTTLPVALSRIFRLAFLDLSSGEATERLSVAKGESLSFGLSLVGAELDEGESLEVRLGVLPAGMGASLVGGDMLRFVRGAQSATTSVSVTRESPLSAFSVSVSDATSTLVVMNASLSPAPSLAVDVLDRRAYSLAFEPSAVGVVANSTLELSLSLVGTDDLLPGEEVLVSLGVSGSGLSLLSASEVSFSLGSTSVGVILSASAGAVETGSISASVRGELPAGIDVSEAMAAVSVLPRALRLSLPSSPLLVVSGLNTSVELTLLGADDLLPEEEVLVSLVGLSGSGFGVEPSSLSMGRSVPSTSLSLMVPRELASVELTAEALSLPMNAEVSSTSVGIRVLPREYALSFSPSALPVIVGTTGTATLSLEGADRLFAGESVAVSLSVAGIAGEGVSLLPDEVAFDSVSTSVEVEVGVLSSVVAATTRLLASVSSKPAWVSVSDTALPVAFSRAFRLAFLDLSSGEATARLSVAKGESLAFGLSLVGAELGEGESLEVRLGVLPEGASASLVGGDTLRFVRGMQSATTSVSVTRESPLSAFSVSVSEATSTLAVMNASLSPAPSLVVDVLERRAYSLAFEPSPVEVVANSTLGLSLSLVGTDDLLPGEEVLVSLGVSGSGLSLLSASEVSFSLGSTSAGVILSASAGAVETGSISASVRGELPAGIDVSEAMAAVSVLPRALRLSLPSSPLLVVSGLNTSVELTLLGADDLLPEEEVLVSLVGLSGSGFGVEPSSLSMGRSVPSTSLSLMVPRELASVELTAEALSLPMNAEVSSTSVGIRVLPREYALSFSPSALPVIVGTTGTATLSLEGADRLFAGESVAVSLSVAGIAGEGVSLLPDEVAFDSVSTSVEVEVGVLSSVVAATTRLLVSVSSKPAWVSVSDTALPVAFSRAFRLAFLDLSSGEATARLSVAKGESLAFGLSLVGAELGEGESLEVRLGVLPEGASASLVGGDTLRFVRGMQSATTSVSVTRESPLSAFSVSVSDATSTLAVMNASLSPVPSLVVDVLDRRAYSLGFEPSAVGVVANSTLRLSLSLVGTGDLLSGEEVLVSLGVSGSGLSLLSASEVSFSLGSTSVEVILSASAGAVETGSISAAVRGELPAGIDVSEAMAAVSVLPRALRLSFPSSPLLVLSGLNTSVELTLLGVDDLLPEEEVLVSLVGLSGSGFEIIPSSLSMGRSTPSTSLSLTVPRELASAELTASAEMLSLPMNAEVSSTSVEVRVLPREYALSFSPSSLPVAAGTTGSVTLSLEGAYGLLSEEFVAVSLSVAGIAVEGVSLLPDEVTFDSVSTSVEVEVGVLSSVEVATTRLLVSVSSKPAWVSVSDTTLPVAFSRAFRLAFLDLSSGEATARLSVAKGESLAFGLSLVGAELGEGESLEVRLGVLPEGASASLVGGDTLRFVRGMQSATTSVSVTRESPLSAFSVSVSDATSTLVVMNASLSPAPSLAVDVLDRRAYSLAFEPSAVGVVANSTLGLSLSLVGIDDLLPGEEVLVSLGVSGSGLSLLSASEVSFSLGSTSVGVRLDAEASASASTVTASVQGELPAGIDVSEAMAAVSVLPRELSLSFPSSPLLVVSGLNTSVELTLLGADDLLPEEEVLVSLVGLSGSGFGVEPSSLSMGRSVPSTSLSLMVPRELESAELRASAEMSSLPMNAEVSSTSVRIQVLPREYALSFSPSALPVIVGTTGTATLSLEGADRLFAGESVAVSLSVAGIAGEGVSLLPDEVTFDSVSTSVEVEVGVLSSVVAATTRLLASVSSKPAWVEVSDTTLPVAFSRAFRLAFLDLSSGEATARLSVAKGESLAFGLSLVGAELGEGESLEVRLGVLPEGASASLVGGDTLRFVRGMQSATTSVSVTRESPLSAFSVSVSDATSTLVVMNASLSPAPSLAVDVLDRRAYSLAFEPSAVGVVANSTLGLSLSLVGIDDLLPGEEVLVSLGVSGSGLSLLSASEVSFSLGSTSVGVRLDAEASASASTVTASVQGELPAGIDVSEAMAAVSVLPRELSLSFPSSPLLVVSGLNTSVELTLLGADDLLPEEEVLVSLVGLSGSGFGVEPSSLSMGRSVPSTSLSLMVPRELESAELRASAEMSSLPMNAEVSSTSVRIQVLPREYALSFSPSALPVIVGTTGTATLSLEGADRLFAGESVAVSLSVAGIAGEGVSLLPDEVTFDSVSTSVEVEVGVLSSVVAATTRLLASVSSKPAWVEVSDTTLPVAFSRAFRLAFLDLSSGEATARLSVAKGESLAFGLSLVGAELGEGESLDVRLGVSSSEGEGASLVGGDTLRFVRGMQSATTSVSVTRESPLSAFSVSVSEATSALVVMNASLSPAPSLVVDVLERRAYSLAFEPSPVEVVANSTLGLSLSLVGTDDLLSGEEVLVSLGVSGSGLSLLSASEVSFSLGSTSVGVILSASAGAVETGSISASVRGELPAGIDVSEAMAAVSVLPRALRLSFPSSPLLVVSGLNTSVELTLLGAASLTATESVEVSLVGLSDSGFSVDRSSFLMGQSMPRVSLTLTAPRGLESAELTAEASLLPMNAEVSSTSVRIQVLPREYALSFSPSALPVIVGTTGTATLSLEGADRLFAGESVAVSLSVAGIAGEGVSLLPDEVTFDSVSTSVEVEVGVLSSVVAATTRLLASVSLKPAWVTVSDTTLPVAFSRAFRLAFLDLSSGEATERLSVAKGELLAFGLSLVGAELGEGESLEVRLGVSPEGEGASLVGGEILRFVRGMQSATTSVSVTRESPLSAFSVSVSDATSTLAVMNASLLPAPSLMVDVLDRRAYSLAFEPSPVEVVANSTLGLSLSLVGTDDLLSGEEVLVSLGVSGSGLSLLSASEVSFSLGSTSVGVILSASAGAVETGSISASVRGELPAGIDVSEAMAAVSVLPRALRLSFPSSPLLVVSGLNTSVELTLLGAASLTATESVEVSLVGLSDSGFSVDRSSFLMGQSMPRVSLTLTAPRGLESAELTAEASLLPMNAEVSSTSVRIQVLPREYALSFSPSALPVIVGTTGTATLSLEGADRLFAGESVAVSLSVAGIAGEGVSLLPDEVAFDSVSTSVEVEVGVLSSVVVATTRLLASVSSKPAWVEVSDTALPVAFSRVFRLAFLDLSSGEATVRLSVAKGESLAFGLSLVGAELGEGESLEVRLGVLPEGASASLVGGDTLRFVRGMQSATTSVSVTRESPLSAFSVSVSDATSTLAVMNASLSPAPSLTVDVLERRAYSLAFEPSAVGVVANSTLGLSLSLVGIDDLLPGEEVLVSLGVSGSGLSLLSASEVSFSLGSTSVGVILSASAGAVETGSISAAVRGELPAGIDVSEAMAAVSVLPRALRLSFPSSPLLVVSGLNTSVELTLLGAASLTATESVEVSLVGLSDSGFSVDRSSFLMGQSMPRVSLTLTAPRGLESAELTAEASLLPMNAEVSSTSVRIQVLPREYALSFSPSALPVIVGTTGTATLSLEGAYRLFAGESVAVSLSVAGIAGEGVSLLPDEVTFDSVSTSVEVEVGVLSSVVAASTRLLASVSSKPAWVSVSDTTLPAAFSRVFRLAFLDLSSGEATARLSVAKGESLAFGLSLVGAELGEGESLEVRLGVSSSEGEGASLVGGDMLRFVRGMQSATTSVSVTRESPLSAFSVSVSEATSTLAVMNASLSPAPSLVVDVLERRAYSLAFEPSPVEVVANSTLGLSLSLVGTDDLLPGEEVLVSLGVSGSGLSLLSASEVSFSLGSTSVGVILSASAGAVETGSISAAVRGELPAGIDVSEAMAAVSVLPRALRLSLPSSPLLVVSGLNTSVELTLLGAASLTATESVEVSLVGLSDSGFSVDRSSFLMGQSMPRVSLTLMVPRELESAELTAEASSLPMNAEVSSTSVGIRVLPREYALSFSPSALPVIVGTTGTATLSLEGAYRLFAGESVAVSLSVAGIAGEGVSLLPDEVTFDSISTSVEVEVGVLSSVVAATTRLLASVSSKPAWVAVSDTALPVAFSRVFRLAFLDLSSGEATERLSVAKGESLAFGLSLVGAELGEGESLDIRLGVSSSEGEGASLVGGDMLRFVRGMQSATTSVSVTRESPLSAFSVSVSDATSTLAVMNASLSPAPSLVVDVLERRAYSLAFEPSPVEVVANSTLGLSLSLVGTDDLLPGEEVLVSLGVSGSGLSLLSASEVSFSLGSTSVGVILSASAGAVETGSISAAVRGELPAGIDVSEAMAAVSVLPRALRLSFPSSPLLVVSGLNTSVELTLLGAASLTATESVEVSLVGLSDSGFSVDRSSFLMGQSMPRVSLTLMVPRELESAELTAEASSLPMNAEVSSTSVGIRVLPREYALSFSPSALPVIVGTTGTATLSLEGADRLFAGESVAVSLSVAGIAGEGVSLLPDEVAFDSVSTSVEVEVGVLSSVVAATTRLLASVSSKPAWVEVSDTALPVAFSRAFRLAFLDLSSDEATERLSVAKGESLAFGLSLVGAELGEGESLDVRLGVSSSEDEGASLVGGEILRFVREMQSATTSVSVTRDSSLSVFSVSVSDATSTLVVMNASLSPAPSLAVDVLERRAYSLAFEPSAVDVVANSTLGLSLSLVGDDDLLSGEEVLVSLGVPEGSGLSLSTSQVSFDSASTSVEVRLDAEASASASTATATVQGELPAGIDVSGAMAEVSVLPRELHLSFTTRLDRLGSGETGYAVKSGLTRGLELELENAGLLTEGESVTVSFEVRVGNHLGPLTNDLLVSPSAVMMGATTSRVSLELSAERQTGALTLRVYASAVPDNAEVSEETVEAEIVTRNYRLNLNPTDFVVGTTSMATLSLEGDDSLLEGQSVDISLSVVEAGVSVSPSEVAFDSNLTSVGVEVGVPLSVVSERSNLAIAVGDPFDVLFREGVRIVTDDTVPSGVGGSGMGNLRLSFSRAFRLAFLDLSGDEATERLSVAKGELLSFGLSLLGAELGEGEWLEVRLGVLPEGTGASLVGGDTLRFVRGMQSATTSVSVTRESSLSAFSVSVLGGDVDTGGDERVAVAGAFAGGRRIGTPGLLAGVRTAGVGGGSEFNA